MAQTLFGQATCVASAKSSRLVTPVSLHPSLNDSLRQFFLNFLAKHLTGLLTAAKTPTEFHNVCLLMHRTCCQTGKITVFSLCPSLYLPLHLP